MGYSVVINMDYAHHSQEDCLEIWEFIKQEMLNAGFRFQGRTFHINLPAEEAAALARGTVEKCEDHKDYPSRLIYGYMSEFYGFDDEKSTNLMLPPLDGIEVQHENGAPDDLVELAFVKKSR